MRVDRTRPKRYPWWQLILLGVVGLLEAIVPAARADVAFGRPARHVRARPLRQRGRGRDRRDRARRARSFFDAPGRRGRGQGRRSTSRSRWCRSRSRVPSSCRCSTARDRAARSRSSAALGRAVSACTRRRGSARCCCSRSRSSCSRCRRCTRSRRTGSPMAYAGPNEGLVRANARLGRIGVGGALLAVGPALLLLQARRCEATLYGAAVVVRGRGDAEPPAAAPARPRRRGRGHADRRDPRAHGAGDRRRRPPRGDRVPAVRARVRAARGAASRRGGSACSRPRHGGRFVGDLLAPRLPSGSGRRRSWSAASSAPASAPCSRSSRSRCRC